MARDQETKAIWSEYIESMDLRLAWLHDDGSTSASWPASTQHYNGVVPNVGDTLLICFGKGHDAAVIAERIHVDGGRQAYWLLLMKRATWPKKREGLIREW